jgi:hypothetical protein
MVSPVYLLRLFCDPYRRRSIREQVKLPFKEMPLNLVEQGRHWRQDAGSTDQGRTQPQDRCKGGTDDAIMS